MNRYFRIGGFLSSANLVAILSIAMFFRIWQLDRVPGVNGDEAWYGVNALSFLRGEHISWTTAVGNPLDLFYFLPLVMLHALFPPSIWLLRVTAVLSGVLALVVNFILCRRVFDTGTASLSTVLLAVLPINIAYARLGWEPSQSLPATVLVVYLSLLLARDAPQSKVWLLWGVIAFLAAARVHPSNVFVGLFLAVAACSRWRDRIGWKGTTPRGRSRWLWLVGAVVITVSGLVALYYIMVPGGGESAGEMWPLLSIPLRRLGRPQVIPLFLRDYCRIFSGTTVFRSMAGSCERALTFPIGGLSVDLMTSDIVTALLFALALLCLFTHCRTGKGETLADKTLLVAGATSPFVFYLLAGAHAVQPQMERFALWLVAPGALILARGARIAMQRWSRLRNAAPAVAILLSWGLLLSFHVNYFRFFDRTGGRSEKTYRTSTVEPKAAALQYILNSSEPGKGIEIVASEWWSYWPLRYLATKVKGAEVILLSQAVSKPHFVARLQPGKVWFVEFLDSSCVKPLRQRCKDEGLQCTEHAINDASGSPLLTLLHPLERKQGPQDLMKSEPVPFASLFSGQEEAGVRAFTLRHYPALPDDEYAVSELYCIDPRCDCRRVLLAVFGRNQGNKPLASLSFNFDASQETDGPFLDPLSPQSQYAEPLFNIVKQFLNDPAYVARLEAHYHKVKQVMGAPSKARSQVVH